MHKERTLLSALVTVDEMNAFALFIESSRVDLYGNAFSRLVGEAAVYDIIAPTAMGDYLLIVRA